ncbi:hypothetical protein D3C71_1303880 [compost metagenome]
MLLQVRLQTLDQVALHLHLIARADFAHARLYPCRGFPLVLDRLVAANVHVLGREQRDHFVEHVFQELEGALLGIEQVREHAPFAERRQGGVQRAQFGVGGDRGGGMAGHVDLGDHLDVAGRRIGDHVADLVLRVEAAVRALGAGHRIAAAIAGRNPATADRGQLRIALDLHAPALVIGEVPVESIELLFGHRVEHALDLVQALEVAGRIEHQPAPAETRRIVDAQRRQGAVGAAGEQLRQRRRAVEQTGLGGGGNGDAIAVGAQLVAFGAGLQRGVQHEADAVLAVAVPDLQGGAAAVVQQGAELAGHARGHVAARPYRGAGRQLEGRPLQALHVGRRGNQRQ